MNSTYVIHLRKPLEWVLEDLSETPPIRYTKTTLKKLDVKVDRRIHINGKPIKRDNFLTIQGDSFLFLRKPGEEIAGVGREFSGELKEDIPKQTSPDELHLVYDYDSEKRLLEINHIFCRVVKPGDYPNGVTLLGGKDNIRIENPVRINVNPHPIIYTIDDVFLAEAEKNRKKHKKLSEELLNPIKKDIIIYTLSMMLLYQQGKN